MFLISRYANQNQPYISPIYISPMPNLPQLIPNDNQPIVNTITFFKISESVKTNNNSTPSIVMLTAQQKSYLQQQIEDEYISIQNQ